MTENNNILIVEDDLKARETLSDILSEEGYGITGIDTISQARKELKNKFYNVALVDIKLPDGTGLELLEEIKKVNEDTSVIIFTGFASVDNVISALNKGAFSYIQKPPNMEEVKISIKKALEVQRLSLGNKELLEKLKTFSLQDPLTGLYNYRYLIERLTSEFQRARRYVLPLSVIMLDIDYFKAINDVHGHQYGDLILKELAQCLKDYARVNDIVVRYGGEEFINLLPDTNKEGAIIFGKRLMDLIKEHIFDPKGKRIRLKVSMGISSFPEDGVDTVSDLIDAADQALHEAKENGGDRLATYKRVSKKDIKKIIGRGGKEYIDILKDKLSKMAARVDGALLESVYAFAKAIKSKDYSTGEHSENMVTIVSKIGKSLNLSDREIENLQHAAMLHDLGKIGIPDKILHKTKRLTKAEYARIKKHPQIGAEIIKSVRSLNGVVPIILYHHERFDGLGYSAGLKGKGIPLGARIIALADVYQALVSDRPYRRAYSKVEALRIIKKGSGTQFDPRIVKIFMRIMQAK